MRWIIYIVAASLLPIASPAQESQDSASMNTAFGQNLIRPLYISYESFGGYDFSSVTQQSDFGQGNIPHSSILNVALAFPLLVKKKVIITGGLSYTLQSHRIDYFKSSGPGGVLLSDLHTIYLHSFRPSVNLIKPFQIKQHIFIALGMVLGHTRNFANPYDVNAILAGAYVLKKRERLNGIVGLAGLIGFRSVIPVVPVAALSYRFNDLWEVNTLFPINVYLHRNLTEQAWIGPGVELTSYTFIKPDFTLPRSGDWDYQLNSTEIRYGLRFEQRLNKFFVIGAKLGIKTYFNHQIVRMGNRQSGYLLDSTLEESFYFNVNFSFSPLLR